MKSQTEQFEEYKTKTPKCKYWGLERQVEKQKNGVSILDYDKSCSSGLYDLIIDNDKLYRAPMGSFEEPLLKGPLPMEYWALHRWDFTQNGRREMLEMNMIRAYRVDEVREFMPIENSYTVRKSNWFVRFIIKIFLRLKIITENSRLAPLEYKVAEINLDEVWEMTAFQIHQMERHGRRPKTIILGRRQQHELMSEVHDAYQSYPVGLQNHTLYGCEIILNPYIDGVVVI